MNEITIIKCNHLGEEVFRWKAKLLEHDGHHALVEAYFTLEGHFMGEITLEPGDRFVETYYTDRWFNCYEVHAHDDDRLKCWYCNIAYPAEITADTITFRDLALDLLVYPDGRQQLLDESEFEDLDISSDDRKKVLTALEELKEECRIRLQK